MLTFSSHLFHFIHSSTDNIYNKSRAKTAQFAKSWAGLTSAKAICSLAPNSTLKNNKYIHTNKNKGKAGPLAEDPGFLF